MCDTESDIEQKKRKRSDQSSLSELDISNSSSKAEASKEKKKETKQERKKRKEKETNTIDAYLEVKKNPESTSSETIVWKKEEMEAIQKELKSLNEKMSKVMTKGDPELQKMIKKNFNEMKEDFLKSVNHRIEILENRLFEREKENDKLKDEIQTLKKKVEEEENKNKQLRRDQDKKECTVSEKLNALEQYSRRNTIRIDGVAVEESESNDTTMEKTVEALNQIDNVHIDKTDIDIAHRVGIKKQGKQQIIAKFISRATMYTIMTNKKSLKENDIPIYVKEDLTKANQHALVCVRKKQPDDVQSAWSINGQIKYKNKAGNIHALRYSEYQAWFDMPWPKKPDEEPSLSA